MARTQRLIRLTTGVAFLLLLLVNGQANADAGGVSVSVWDNNTGFNQYNASPPLPPTTRLAGEYTGTDINSNFDAQPVFNLVDDFVVRFQGNITAPITGDVRFFAPADDGVKFYLSDVLLIDDWYDKGGGGSISEPVAMQAGMSQPFTLWFYENGGGAWVRLMWEIDGQWQIVPASAFSLSPIEPTTTTEPATTTTEQTTTTTEASTTTTIQTQTTLNQVTATTVQIEPPVVVTVPATTTTAVLPSTLPSSVPVATVPVPVSTYAPATTQQLPTTTLPLPTTTSSVPFTTTTTIQPTQAPPINAETAKALATNPEALQEATAEEAQQIFEALDINELDPVEIAELIDAVQDAPQEVREAFESEVNVFDGAVDSYVPIGSTVPISTRRLVIAAGAMLSAVPVSSGKRK